MVVRRILVTTNILVVAAILRTIYLNRQSTLRFSCTRKNGAKPTSLARLKILSTY